MSTRSRIVGIFSLACLYPIGLTGRTAWAFGGLVPPAKPVPTTTAEPVADENVLTPPILVARPQAPYPTAALIERVEGNVGLELAIDASGRVTDVRVTTPAGHGFDEAASAAARDFVFRPARRGTEPIASKVLFTYEFRLPAPAPRAPVSPEPAPSAPSPAPAPAPPPAEHGAAATPAATSPDAEARAEVPPDSHLTTLVRASRPTSAASSFSVQDRDFQLRPIASVQDILRVTPGLTMVQHSGGGKANQYFLRGFDADHGTDRRCPSTASRSTWSRTRTDRASRIPTSSSPRSSSGWRSPRAPTSRPG